MRLIDADKFYQELSELYNSAGWDEHEVHFSLTDTYWNLRGAQSIEAIPVEWIKKYMEDHICTVVNPKYEDDVHNYIQFTEKPLDYYLTLMPVQVDGMLRAWRRENETN